ncbi:MAG: hypothetical protein LBE84_09060 [Planctomycetota bacterium]|jgi:FlaA1/EpsC-like NDP-sugar epimerase|nr:hypothetical protein [Planctomycetota bacterium]
MAVDLSIGVAVEKIRDRSNIALFGCGDDGKRALAALRNAGIAVSWFCDNNPALWGKPVGGVKVLSPRQLREMDATVIIATSRYYGEIKAQLSDLGITAVNA